ncbi:MAG TPA: OB-fold domain-containing protein [Candidatus Binatia bacterium]|nr:OB-fold domain-containing protein [Candidatus Binatia bacterium]
MESGFLLPDPEDDDAAPFWQGAARGELRVQTCASCGRRRMPPRPMCPSCRSLDHDWHTLSGRGTIWSFVVAHPPLLPAYQALAPYNVITVALDEDPSLRLVGNLVARPDGPINEIDPTTIRIGDRVQVVFQPVDDMHLPQWMRTDERR